MLTVAVSICIHILQRRCIDGNINTGKGSIRIDFPALVCLGYCYESRYNECKSEVYFIHDDVIYKEMKPTQKRFDTQKPSIPILPVFLFFFRFRSSQDSKEEIFVGYLNMPARRRMGFRYLGLIVLCFCQTVMVMCEKKVLFLVLRHNFLCEMFMCN